MRVLIAGPLPDPIDGCSYANQVLVLALRGRGHDVDTIDTASRVISGQHGRFSIEKVSAFLLTYLRLPRLAHAQVVYLTPGQTFFGLLKYAPFMALAKVLRKPYVIHLHGNHLGSQYKNLKGVKRWLFRICVQNAAAGIALSDSLKTNFNGLLPPTSVFVVENFAGDALFVAPQYSKPTDKLRILYLSNLMRDKGVLVLLEALCLLKTKGISFSALLAGHMEAGIEADIQQALGRLSHSTEYLGPIHGEAKRQLLEEANVFVLPTHYPMEGQPISILEGLATGNVIVTTNHAGIPDVVGPDHGFLVPVRNARALADALEKISINVPGALNQFSESNRHYAKTRFTETAFADRVLAVLEHVVRKDRFTKISANEPT